MMYKYLSVLLIPLAVGINLSHTNSANSEEVLTNKDFTQHNIDLTSLIATPTIAQIDSGDRAEPSYLGLMNAGYNANEKQDYLTAIDYFQQALDLQPGDSKAQTAIKTISSYGFDLYMQMGYAADRLRDYSTALNHFQKALQIRPDSFYAKQAVSNVTNYLAQQPIEGTGELENNGDNTDGRNNLSLMFIVIGIASVLSAVLLFYLFKKTGSSLQTELDKAQDKEAQTESIPEEVSERLEPLTEASRSAQAPPTVGGVGSSPTANNPEPIKTEDKATEVEKSQSTDSTTTSDNKTSVVSPRNSLARLDIVPELIQDLSDSDRSIRSKTIWELAQRGDSRAMKPLVELMVEVDSQERGLILEAMTQIAGRTLKPMNKAIMMSLEDDNSNVKQNAIRDLTRVYELMSQVTKRLSLVVEDSDERVQETAKWALHKLNQMPDRSASPVDNLTNEINSINANSGINGSDRIGKPGYPLS